MAGQGSGNSGIDAANLLKPALARGTSVSVLNLDVETDSVLRDR